MREVSIQTSPHRCGGTMFFLAIAKCPLSTGNPCNNSISPWSSRSGRIASRYLSVVIPTDANFDVEHPRGRIRTLLNKHVIDDVRSTVKSGYISLILQKTETPRRWGYLEETNVIASHMLAPRNTPSPCFARTWVVRARHISRIRSLRPNMLIPRLH